MSLFIIDIAGTELSADDRILLTHPLIAGVILFARNAKSFSQVKALTQAIRQCNASLLITVDQEGGRVQRLIHGFSALPSLSTLAQLPLSVATDCAKVMAYECLAVGIDLSFAPVIDLNWQHNTVIDSRSFGRNPHQVTEYAIAYCQGMQQAGMASVAKHFPGHGFVSADSHAELPIDPRDYKAIENDDLLPFKALIDAGVQGIMPAHIIFEAIDSNPSSLSAYWLGHVLRERLQFKNTVISDDLSMNGAGFIQNRVERAKTALQAGCDLVLLCNDRDYVLQCIAHEAEFSMIHNNAATQLLASPARLYQNLNCNNDYQHALQTLQNIEDQYE